MNAASTVPTKCHRSNQHIRALPFLHWPSQITTSGPLTSVPWLACALASVVESRG